MNQEICRCLDRWHEEAQAKGKENFARAFLKALRSVEKCKEPIMSVEQTRGICGVGPYIAARIEKHFRENPCQEVASDAGSQAQEPPRRRTGSGQRAYTPRYRSAPFGLLVALRQAEIESVQFLTKKDLISMAQPYCDEPLEKTAGGSHHGRKKFSYDGWTSMNATLVKKGLVIGTSNPKKFALTSEGRKLADTLRQKLRNVKLVESVDALGDVSTPLRARPPAENTDCMDDSRATAQEPEPERLAPSALQEGEFEVVLLIDNREVYGGGGSREDFRRQVEQLSACLVEVVLLEAGDAVFVARTRGPGGETVDYVLDFLTERKTVDDLAESIVDGRYERQKHYMRKSGIANLLFVVEGDVGKQNLIPTASLRTEILRASVQEGFLLFQTQNLQETVQLYSSMHKWIHRKYKKWALADICRERKPLPEWNEDMKALRQTRVEDIFWLMLLQIPGIGRTKIRKVLDRGDVRTFADLEDRYHHDDDGGSLLSRLAPDAKFSRDLSSSVHKLFTRQEYGGEKFSPRRSRGARNLDTVVPAAETLQDGLREADLTPSLDTTGVEHRSKPTETNFPDAPCNKENLPAKLENRVRGAELASTFRSYEAEHSSSTSKIIMID